MARDFALCIALLCVACAAEAQSQRTEHTLSLDDPESRPAATFEDVRWMVGSWTGEAFGADFEQVWNPPSAGSMAGMFKVIRDDEVQFYELILLVETEGSLAIRVKHFAADMTAWEEKEEYLSFPLVRVEENAVHFSGLSFYRIDDETIHGYIVMKSSDGIREEKLSYRRVGS